MMMEIEDGRDEVGRENELGRVEEMIMMIFSANGDGDQGGQEMKKG